VVLHAWRPEHAAALAPLLERNQDHIAAWIPKRVSTPAPVSELARRLEEFAAEFDADQQWRYGLFTADGNELLGEVDLFPRDASARVQFNDADRVEAGYWLRGDMTGRGYITEAVRAALGVAAGISRFQIAEIRCDARNAASAAVPGRLGFTLSETVARDDGSELQVWTAPLQNLIL
jgi:RimJ/RimL family protein N-acetyltransferase